ncbi:MAG: RNA pseudouridine synthase, partial [Erysipelotrichaceae bacterium]|nr:RNA pseudouridine synthase [Erysipelotrichaceae bacterium]
QATLTDYLYHDKTRNKTFVVKKLRKGVKEAILDYVVLDTNDTNSLVEVHLHTGRTHQIRVQFASRQHPLVGDGKYGSKDNRCEVSLWSSACQFLYNGVNKQYACRPEWQYPWNQFTE